MLRVTICTAKLQLHSQMQAITANSIQFKVTMEKSCLCYAEHFVWFGSEMQSFTNCKVSYKTACAKQFCTLYMHGDVEYYSFKISEPLFSYI